MFKAIPIIFINQEIADIAIEYRKRKKIKLPDAFIFAPSKYLDADLITNNTTDFTNIDDTIKIIKPSFYNL